MSAASHPSAYDLERHSVALRRGGGLASVASHLDACETCRAFVTEMEEERRAMLARTSAAAFAHRVAAAGGGAWWQRLSRPAWAPRWQLAGLAAAAVAAGVIAVVAMDTRSAPEDGLRVMGSPQLTVFLKHGDVVRTVDASTVVSAGDALRFRLDLPSAGHVAVFFLDETGSLSWLIPATADGDARPVPAGEVLLGESAVLDVSPRAERVFVQYRRAPFRPLAVARGIQAAWQSAAGQAFEEATWIPDDSGLWSLLLRKP